MTGAQIRAARGFLNWSVRDLGKKAKVHFNTVHAIEHGKSHGKPETLAASKWMIFQIEEMNEAIIEGLKLGPRDESLLELSRITGHVIQSEDKQEPTQYECEAP